MSENTNGANAGRPLQPVRERRIVLLVLAMLGLGAALVQVPGVFTIDENNYLAWLVSLRAGRLHLPGTDGLPFSRELLFFDPVLRTAGPIASTMPPLYALFALPFSLLGWSGLYLLNLVAWLASTSLLYAAARRAGAEPPAAWVGALAFALAGFSLEYAVGVWPHALAALLCLAALLAVLDAAERGQAGRALAAGVIAGLAAGLRYQHVVTAALIGVVLIAAVPRRPRLAALYGLGLALPLGLSAFLNGLRAGVWHPASKGPGYVTMSGLGASAPSTWDPLRSFAARVLDFSLQPHAPVWEEMGGRWSETGALLLLSAVKKALLQSAPWIAVVLVALAAAWAGRAPAGAARRILRAVGFVTAGVLVFFALQGTQRHEGWSHNPRYLFELVPLAALALALTVQRERLSWRTLAAGAAAGVLVAVPPLVLHPTSALRQLALLYVPLAMGVLAAGLYAAVRWRPGLRRALAPALGVLLGWAAAVHAGDDLRAARTLRRANLDRLTAVAALLPAVPAAVFAHQPAALGPLLLERDLVIVDTGVDQGRDAPMLLEALQRAGRRAFAVLPGMPEAERHALLRGRLLRPVGGAASPFVEIGPPARTR